MAFTKSLGFICVWILTIVLVTGQTQNDPARTQRYENLLQRFVSLQESFSAQMRAMKEKLRVIEAGRTPTSPTQSYQQGRSPYDPRPTPYAPPAPAPAPPPTGKDLQPVKARVDIFGDTATYIIDYRAAKEPRVIWRADKEPVAISTEGIVTKVFHYNYGRSTLRISKRYEVIASLIVDHVTFVIAFRPNPTKSLETIIDPSDFSVSPGPDVPFKSGKSVNFTVEARENVPGYQRLLDFQWTCWLANNTLLPGVIEEYPHWREVQGGVVRVGPLRTINRENVRGKLRMTYELLTQYGDYEGILIFSRYLGSNYARSVIKGMTELRYVIIRQEYNLDPFPLGFIDFVQTSPPIQPCIENQTCSIACHAIGNVPDYVVLKMNGHRMLPPLPRLEVREPYMLYTHFGIKRMSVADEGEYTCSASSGNHTVEISTRLAISQEVQIVNQTSGVHRSGNKIIVTCTATGRPLPRVTMFENYAYRNEMLEGMNYRHQRWVDRNPSVSRVIFRITINIRKPDLWRVICMADNPFHLKVIDFAISAPPPSHSVVG